METNKLINHILWMMSASKEQMRFLFKDIKGLSQNLYLSNSTSYKKVLYHLNMSIVLLNQLEKSYLNVFSNGNINSKMLIKIKNTYLQRCVFNFSMVADYYKEIFKLVESMSYQVNKAISIKINNLKGLLEKITLQIDCLLKQLNK